MKGKFIEIGEGDQVGDDVGADEVPKKMAEKVSNQSAKRRGDRPDPNVEENVFPVLQAEKHENGVERDEEE